MTWSDFWKWLLDRFRPKPKPDPTPTPDHSPSFVQELLKLHNVHRQKHNLPLLALEPKLVNAAQQHSDWMFANNTMSHYQNGKGVGERVRDAGFYWTAVGENIAAGHPNAPAVFQGWLNSSGHRKNIENPNFTHVGFGLNGRYWTTVFARSARHFMATEDEQPEGIIFEIDEE